MRLMKKAPGPKRKSAVREMRKQTLSTSEARANFADALGLAQEENTVIGFERYGRLVAAVVSIDAVRLLAGRGEDVAPAVREKIARMSEVFLKVTSATATKPSQATMQASAPLKSPKRKGGKGKRQKRSKPASAKRHRRTIRKI